MRLLLFLIFSLISAEALILARADDSQIYHDVTVTSPDGRFTIRQRDDGYFDIIDHLKPGEPSGPPFDLPSPHTVIQWTGDSKTIIAVGHIAEGSIGVLLHWTPRGWIMFHEPYIPTDSAFQPFYDVVQAKPKEHSVSFTYKVALSYRNPDRYECSIYSFDQDANTGIISNAKSRPIDIDAFRSMKVLQP